MATLNLQLPRTPSAPLRCQPLGEPRPLKGAGGAMVVVSALLAFCVGCCTPCTAPSSAASSASQTQTARRIEQFQSLTSGMTLEAVRTLCGPPDRDTQSEKITWLYVLADGSAVFIDADRSGNVAYVYHVLPGGVKVQYLVGRN
jgi:hypothetical protein